MGIVPAYDKILRLLSDRRPRSYKRIKSEIERSDRAVARAIRRLKKDGFIEKDLGKYGQWQITNSGLVANKTGLLNKLKTKARRHIEMVEARIGIEYGPIPPPLPDVRWENPYAEALVFSDNFDSKELGHILATTTGLGAWIQEAVEYFASKQSGLLSGNWPVDQGKGVLTEDEEKSYYERHGCKTMVSWYNHAYNFHFGLILRFDGEAWTRKIDWKSIMKRARELDDEFEKDESRQKQDKTFQGQLRRADRYTILSHIAARADRFLEKQKDWASVFGFSFSKEDLKGVVHPRNSELLDSLINEGKFTVAQQTIYRLVPTPSGLSEIADFEKEMAKHRVHS